MSKYNILNIANGVLVIMLFIIGYFLFSVKHEVNNLNYQLVQINKQLKDEINSINIAQAEFSHLTSPEKLKLLSKRYLDLQSIIVSQMCNDPLSSDYNSLDAEP